jgi:hypothetical protein
MKNKQMKVLVEQDGSLRLVPKITIDRSHAYFWTERWQQGEREAEEDLRAGRFREFTSMDELIQDLETKLHSISKRSRATRRSGRVVWISNIGSRFIMRLLQIASRSFAFFVM